MEQIPIYHDDKVIEYVKSRNEFAKLALKKGVYIRPLFSINSYKEE